KHPKHRAERGVSGLERPRTGSHVAPLARRLHRVRQNRATSHRGGSGGVAMREMLPDRKRQSDSKFSETSSGLLQRKCACGGPSHSGEDCENCGAGSAILQRRDLDGALVPTIPPIVYQVLRTTGTPLDAQTRGFMETRFGHDFNKVRVHADGDAASSALAVGARAYAVGQHLVFGTGQYAPETIRGKRLLAHELTHTIQQASGGIHASTLQVGQRGDVFEREADSVATAVLNGHTPHLPSASITATRLQKEDLNIGDFDSTDINPQQALVDPQYVDNGIMDGALRSNGAIMSPVFTGFDVFYEDGS